MTGTGGRVGDGDGWRRCGLGHTHWGRHGAAGLLLHDAAAEPAVLLQHRAGLGFGGDTWALLGGARHSHEDPVAAALREASEESDLDPATVRVHGVYRDDHGGWAFDTVVAQTARRLPVRPASWESRDVAWVEATAVTDLPLLPAFARTWPAVRSALRRLVLVVDVANVMGSRPDGWWRDRAGAAARLRDQILPLAYEGIPGDRLDFGLPALDRWYPAVTLVVEGAARAVAARQVPRPEPPAAGGVARSGPSSGMTSGAPPGGITSGAVPPGALEGVRVVAAPGDGDDLIAGIAEAAAPADVTVVVTADRALRARCERAGAYLTGPSWLLAQLQV